MQKHIKNFRKHYNIAENEVFMCQYCNRAPAVDIHHIIHRSQGGGDEVDNLIGLCRLDHESSHKKTITAEELFSKIAPYVKN